MTNQTLPTHSSYPRLAVHGWLGLGLIAIFWPLNWLLPGTRSQWAFFPLWLGYCLTVDALVLWRRGTSLLTRSWRRYVGLFAVSARPGGSSRRSTGARKTGTTWQRPSLQPGKHGAIQPQLFDGDTGRFGTAELAASFDFIQRLGRGPLIGTDRRTTAFFCALGWVMFGLMMAWPLYFFPSSGCRSISSWSRLTSGWAIPHWPLDAGRRLAAGSCPVAGGVSMRFLLGDVELLFLSKWQYTVPGVGFLHVFEMPLLGYGGYLPFAMELHALYHLVAGLLGHKTGDYVQLSRRRLARLFEQIPKATAKKTSPTSPPKATKTTSASQGYPQATS